MDKRPVSEKSRHMTSDNTHDQNDHQYRHYGFNTCMDKPDQTDMNCCHHASPLVWPVATVADIEYDEGASCSHSHVMPGGKLPTGNCPENTAKHHACRADVTAS